MKKKLLALALAVIAAFTLVACSSKSGEEVTFFYWGGTIDEEVLTLFEKETGIKVKSSEFDENEKMYTLVKNSPGLYDVVVPSEYMVQKMISEGLLEELDHSKLSNLKEISPLFLDKTFDPGNKYSLPMFFGTVGILYNTTKVDAADMNEWDAVFNEKYKDEIWMLDSSRDTLGVGFWHLGYSANSKNEAELKEVVELMKNQKALVKGYLQDEIKQHMVNGNGSIAVVYSGEAREAIEENSDLAFYIPNHSNVWIDNFAVVKGTKNYDNALKLIDFLNRPEIAAMNGAFEATPVEKAKEIEPAKSLADNKVLYPDAAVLDELEAYEDLGAYVETFEAEWENIKNH